MFSRDYWFVYINPSIVKELAEYRPDVFILSGYESPTYIMAYITARMLGAKLIYWTDSVWTKPPLLRRLAGPLIRFIVGHADACVASSSRSKEYLIRYGAKKERIFLSPLTTDIRFFFDKALEEKAKRASSRQLLGIPPSAKVILFVGRLVGTKGIMYLLKAFKSLSRDINHAYLLIIGKGPMESEIMKFSSETGIIDRVILGGYIENHILPKYYSLSDVLVLPSLYESFGLVLCEAMASGLPVVASDRVGAAQDLIKDGFNGRIVPAEDVESLAEALYSILRNPRVMEKMGRNSLCIIKNWTIDQAFSGLLSAIKYVINGAFEDHER